MHNFCGRHYKFFETEKARIDIQDVCITSISTIDAQWFRCCKNCSRNSFMETVEELKTINLIKEKKALGERNMDRF